MFENLTQKAQQSDEGARQHLVDQMVAQFAEAGFRWALAVLGDENAACDALQDAWLNAYLHLDQLRENAAFPGWFRQIVLSACFRTIRHDRITFPLVEENDAKVVSPQADPADEIEITERREHIWAAVSALPDPERIVVEMFYFGDVSQQEIAEVIALPITTVKKRLQYARERLKRTIQPEFVNQLVVGTFDDDYFVEEMYPTAPPVEWIAIPPIGMLFGVTMERIYEREIECSLRWD